MKSTCYIFMYAFEQVISYLFFSNRYDIKVNKKLAFFSYVVSFGIQFTLNFLNLPVLNIVSFLICNFFILYLVYESNISEALFDIFLLEVLMIVTEYVVFFGADAAGLITTEMFRTNPNAMLIGTLSTKSLYFLAVYTVSKIRPKAKGKIKGDYSLILMLFPACSILVMLCFAYLTTHFILNNYAHVLFIITSVLLLFSGLTAAVIHEKNVSMLKEKMENELELQKTKINNEYYGELEKQNALSDILIHDIKRHLNIIQALSFQKDTDGIIDYIKSVQNNSEIKTIKLYSDNKLVNVIVSRYAYKCIEENIDFTTDIRSVDMSFIDMADLTTILDNLLENSYFAAKNSAEKKIFLNIADKNEKYLVFRITNSSEYPPTIKHGNIITTKNDGFTHGIGLKSVKKVALKYNGDLNWKYDDSSKQFSVSVIIETP